jgi:hypothetical protein
VPVNAGGIAAVEMLRPCSWLIADTETTAEALCVVAATLVALTVTLVEEFTTGAVNNPDEEIVPALDFHVTPVWLVPVMVAANCCFPPEITLVLAGETEMLMPDPVPKPLSEVPLPTAMLNVWSP